MEKDTVLHLLTASQVAIIKRLKRLPPDADDDDVSMALDEIIDELSAGQSS